VFSAEGKPKEKSKFFGTANIVGTDMKFLNLVKTAKLGIHIFD
jgi:hypothetical protein